MKMGIRSKPRVLHDREQLLKALRDSEKEKTAELGAQEREHLVANLKQRIAELEAMIDGAAA